MFDEFLSICKTDYVGIVDKDTTDMIHEIFKQISHIKMEGNNRSGGCQATYTPDKLYGKHISTDASLPNNADLWSVTLCTSYFNCLNTTLQDKMEYNNFRRRSLNNQCTKSF